jgi:hypothetical protein
MNDRTLYTHLCRAHAGMAGRTPTFAADLESRVLSHYEKRYAARGRLRRLRLPRSVPARIALASAMLLALVGVACEIPTSSRVQMGHHVVVRYVAAMGATADEHVEAALRQVLEPLGADAVRIGLSHRDDGLAHLDIVAWGEHLTPDAVERAVTGQIGAPRIRTIQTSALTATVTESLGRRMGRHLFGLDVEHQSAAELRAAILERLTAEGFDGDADVQVEDDGSMRRIRIDADTKDGSRQVADEILLDPGNDR